MDEKQVVVDLEGGVIAEEPLGVLRWKLEVDDPFEVVASLKPPAGRQALDRESLVDPELLGFVDFIVR